MAPDGNCQICLPVAHVEPPSMSSMPSIVQLRFRTIQHNEVRDLVAEILRETKFSGVETEPLLQPLSGESFKLKSANKDQDARDVKCVGFWRKMRQAYDVKVVSPFARSYFSQTHKQLYRTAEQANIREYKARINEVEHADFTPLVFTTAGGMAPQSQLVVKRLSALLAEFREITPSIAASWIRCRFSFALLRTTLICLRGTRKRRFVCSANDIERAVHECRIEH